MKKVLVTGGSGFVGGRLLPVLLGRGDKVAVLGRKAPDPRLPAGVESLAWTPEQKGAWYRSVDGVDAVVHLAGEPVLGKRWTQEHKDRVLRSRVESTRQIVTAMREAAVKPSTFVCASAVGYYGGRSGADELDEQSAAGDDFLADVVKAWEAEADRASELGIRVVKLRIGLVLGDAGGMLAQMAPAFRFFVGGPVGPGSQMLPWIHVDDAVGLILLSLDNDEARGAINVTAPRPVSMDDFARELGKAMGRPAVFRVPTFLLRVALGEASQPVITGQNAIPRAAQRLGYSFRHPALPGALADLFEKKI